MPRPAHAIALSILLGLAGIGAAHGQGRTPMTTKEKWVVDFDEEQCVATRNYGKAADPLFLAIKAPPLARVYQVAVVRRGASGNPSQHEVDVIFGDGSKFTSTLLAYNANKRRVYVVNIPADKLAPVTSSPSIRIRASGAVDRSFELTSMKDLLATLDTCVTDLEAYWGGVSVTPEGLSPARPATGNLQGLVKADDYPDAAIWELQGGTVDMILLVNEAGRVADCTVNGTSGVAVLDAQACFVIKERARFTPAIGPDGKPARGMFRQRITWRIQ